METQNKLENETIGNRLEVLEVDKEDTERELKRLEKVRTEIVGFDLEQESRNKLLKDVDDDIMWNEDILNEINESIEFVSLNGDRS